MEALICC